MSQTTVSALLLTLVLTSPLPAQSDDIPIGIEAVTGLRSGYLYRGFKLADTALDFQIETEIALSEDTFLNTGAWHLAESDGDFSESGVFLDFRHALTEKWILGSSLLYRNFDHAVFDSGVDAGLSLSYQINDSWDWKSTASYDFGAEGFYASSDLRWSYVVSDSSFLNLLGGLSAVSDYYGRDGLNDLYLRLTYTYAFNERIALTPFIGGSFVFDDEGYLSDDEAYGGIWFEVNF
ncbi:MAG: hypothetical protein ACQKBY_12800 [Verrucomicrobiales bacterium]